MRRRKWRKVGIYWEVAGSGGDGNVPYVGRHVGYMGCMDLSKFIKVYIYDLCISLSVKP